MGIVRCPKCTKDVEKAIDIALSKRTGRLVNGGRFYIVHCPYCQYPIGVIDARGRSSTTTQNTEREESTRIGSCNKTEEQSEIESGATPLPRCPNRS